MAKIVKVFNILISCPGDIKEEVEVIKSVIEQFNRTTGDENNIRLEAKHWSKDSYPESGGKAQALLNQQFVEECDMSIAVLWTRFGTPTEKYGSGTEEEISLMIESGKQVFLYLSKKPISPDEIDSEQYNLVKKFIDKYSCI